MLSILTNFGCHWSCPYCVYRENKINIPLTTRENFDFKALEEEMKNMDGDEISISGGGDPLYNWKNNMWFYNEIQSLAGTYNKKIELHTSYIDYNFDYSDFDRVVFHLQSPTQIRLIDMGRHRLWLSSNVRVVFVIQEHYSKGIINNIIKEVENNEDVTELVSFRQLIKIDGAIAEIEHEYLKSKHLKDLYYIKQADYNEYFVNNHIEKEYLKIK